MRRNTGKHIYREPWKIRRRLQQLRTSTAPGESNDGATVQIGYQAYTLPTRQAEKEAGAARRAKLDLEVYTGVLDRVWRARGGALCITLLVLERIRGDKYLYRTMNTHAGEIRFLNVLKR